MSALVDRTGQRYGRLLVLYRANDKKKGRPIWVCQCDCGVQTYTTSSSLSNDTKSCGCLKVEKATKHGSYNTRLYHIWEGIKARTTNPKHEASRRYLERGISVCPEWCSDFCVFKEWAMDNGYEEHLEIDRQNNDLGYYPENCRWVTTAVNRMNASNVVTVEFDGKKIKLMELFSKQSFPVSLDTVRKRLRNGWCAEKALYQPSKQQKKVL